jgi:hypothetical protein
MSGTSQLEFSILARQYVTCRRLTADAFLPGTILLVEVTGVHSDPGILPLYVYPFRHALRVTLRIAPHDLILLIRYKPSTSCYF